MGINFSSSLTNSMGISLGGLEIATDYLFANPDFYEPELTEVKSTIYKKDVKTQKHSIKPVRPKVTKERILNKFNILADNKITRSDEVIDIQYNIQNTSNIDISFDDDIREQDNIMEEDESIIEANQLAQRILNENIENENFNNNLEQDDDFEISDDDFWSDDTEAEVNNNNLDDDDNFDISNDNFEQDNVEDNVEDDEFDIDEDDLGDIEEEIEDDIGIDENDLDDIDNNFDIDENDISNEDEEINTHEDLLNSNENNNVDEQFSDDEFDIDEDDLGDIEETSNTNINTTNNNKSTCNTNNTKINIDNQTDSNNNNTINNSSQTDSTNNNTINNSSQTDSTNNNTINNSALSKDNPKEASNNDEIKRMQQKVADMERQIQKLKEKSTSETASNIRDNVNKNKETDSLDALIDINNERNHKKQDIKENIYDKYTVMSIDSLYNVVKQYMIELGVSKRPVDLIAVNQKFGELNIRKLIQKSYLIKVGKGVTIGR